MDDYISKPFDPATLLAKLQHLAAFRSAGEERAPQGAGERPETKAQARFDRAKLDQLGAATSPTVFASLLTSLVEAVEQRVATILDLIESGSYDPAGREAHDLVSIAGHVGGMRLSQLARQLQHACKAGEVEKCRAVAAALRAEAEAALPLIRDYRAAMAA
jgi:HPt (histidine-containing phosphotransfer) domain-containing protein